MPKSTSIFDGVSQQTLKKTQRVMLIVDFINPLQFPGAENLLEAALQAACATSKLKQRLKESGATVIYANDNYGIWRSEFRDLLQACKALPGTRGEIATMLAPSGDDLTILKPLHSAFHGTPLEHLLKQMEAKELIITGLSADMCIHLTAMDAYMRGFKIWIPVDCTAAENINSKNSALNHISTVFKCSIRKSNGRL